MATESNGDAQDDETETAHACQSSVSTDGGDGNNTEVRGSDRDPYTGTVTETATRTHQAATETATHVCQAATEPTTHVCPCATSVHTGASGSRAARTPNKRTHTRAPCTPRTPEPQAQNTAQGRRSRRQPPRPCTLTHAGATAVFFSADAYSDQHQRPDTDPGRPAHMRERSRRTYTWVPAMCRGYRYG